MFAENLRRLRINKGLTQKELADKLSLSPSAIGMYEQGRREPDLTTLKKICDFFEVSCDMLLGIPQYYDISEISNFIFSQPNVTYKAIPLTREEKESITSALKIGAELALERRKK